MTVRRSSRHAEWVARLALAGLLLAWATHARAVEPSLEASVKAAYLYKFLSFVEWPAGAFAEAGSPIVIGVAGDEQVLTELQRMLPERTVQGRALQARKVQPGDATSPLHVLLVGSRLTRHPWLGRLNDQPVLLVTDAPGGLEAGGVINFLRVEGRVRFEVSLAAAERSGVRLSSRMLSVAERVVGAR